MKKIMIHTPYITLGQLLKFADVIGGGGEAKSYLETHQAFVNDVLDQRRGRKLYPGDRVSIPPQLTFLIQAGHEDR
jgi:ribosome-associated protein YbcJ (S4-like RNA binding protein)